MPAALGFGRQGGSRWFQGFRALGLGIWVQGLGFRALGLGIWVLS